MLRDPDAMETTSRPDEMAREDSDNSNTKQEATRKTAGIGKDRQAMERDGDLRQTSDGRWAQMASRTQAMVGGRRRRRRGADADHAS